MLTSHLKRLSFGALFTVITLLVAATFIEKYCGTPFAVEHIYHSPAFIALWAVLALSAMAYLLKRHIRIISSTFLLHVSLAVILVGAVVSFLTSERGKIYISPGGVPASMYEMQDGKLGKLPFRIELEEFITEHRNGAADDYIATVVVGGTEKETISMNRPLYRQGYLIYIDGYSQESVSLLVGYDPWGTGITYGGYIMLVASLIYLFLDKRSLLRAAANKLKGKEHESGRKHPIEIPITVAAAILFAVLSIMGTLRWIETSHFPASDGHGTTLLLAWCALLTGFVVRKRTKLLMYPAFTVAAIATFAAAITTGGSGEAAPVLRTPLLALHVTTIIVAYAIIGCTAIVSAIGIWHMARGNRTKCERLADVGHIMLYPALSLLLTGVFIGAVWANLSWGRYWGWDPKEVWALVTILICSIPMHRRSLPALSKPLNFHIFCIVTFIVMLFTYLGTNWIFGGMHSYL